MSAYLPYTGRLRSFLVACDLAALLLGGWLAHLVRFSAGPRAKN